MRLILASSSVYRRNLLERLQTPFTCISPDVDESALANEAPHDTAHRLSIAKAQAVYQHNPNSIVIGSDQVAVCNEQAIGKPGSPEKAHEQLRFLSGKTVLFHTGVCLIGPTSTQTDIVTTTCRFRVLSEQEICTYLALDTPYDTAGSAKAESLGIALMEYMRSDDPTAIIGLPMITLSRMLRTIGINPLTAHYHA